MEGTREHKIQQFRSNESNSLRFSFKGLVLVKSFSCLEGAQHFRSSVETEYRSIRFPIAGNTLVTRVLTIDDSYK
jgi:hypothetical protein